MEYPTTVEVKWLSLSLFSLRKGDHPLSSSFLFVAMVDCGVCRGGTPDCHSGGGTLQLPVLETGKFFIVVVVVRRLLLLLLPSLPSLLLREEAVSVPTWMLRIFFRTWNRSVRCSDFWEMRE